MHFTNVVPFLLYSIGAIHGTFQTSDISISHRKMCRSNVAAGICNEMIPLNWNPIFWNELHKTDSQHWQTDQKERKKSVNLLCFIFGLFNI